MEQSSTRGGTVGRRNALKLALLSMGFYAITYLCRKSFDSNINEIIDFYGQEKSAVGLIGTFFFIAYAVGQVFHGFMCRYYRPRLTVLVMALTVAAMNVAMGLMPVSAFPCMKYLWLVNGFACASFWSLLILMLNRAVAKPYKPIVVLISSFPVSVGTFLSYGASALYSFLGKFQISFFAAGGLIVLYAAFWFIVSKGLLEKCEQDKAQIDGEEEPSNSERAVPNAKKSRIAKAFYVEFALLAFFSIVNNLVRDGVNTWTPSILKEMYGMPNWMSVLLSVLVPLCAIFGSMLAISLYRRVKNYTVDIGFFYLLCAGAIGILMLCLSLNAWAITLLCLILSSVMMAAVNNVTTNIYPMNSPKEVNAGTVAGLIDGFCYVGSAISSYGVGKIAEGDGGWKAVFLLFLTASFACVSIALLASLLFKKKEKQTESL